MMSELLLDPEDEDLRASARMNPQGRWQLKRKPHCGKLIYRVIAERMGLAIDGLQVDHKNCNPSDNTRNNLRVATGSQNKQNSRRSKNSKSGFKGVFSCGHKWRARLTLDNRKIHLGYFPTAEEAARAYDEAARKHFGEFARLNF